MTPDPSRPDSDPEILVVDDERGYREGIRRVLAGRGYFATTAEDGGRALELAATHDYAVALVDLKMPGVDGFEVIQQLRCIRPNTLCIVVSAFGTIESAVQTTKMGAFDFVVKPFAPDDLIRVLERALEQWRLAREAERLRAERDRHLLEIAVEKSRLHTILQSMGDGLLVVNIDGEVVLDNPAARGLLGLVQEGCASKPLSVVLPEPRVAREVERFLSSPSDTLPVRLEVTLGADSQDRCLRATIAPIRDPDVREDTAPAGVVVLLADITDAKAYERMRTLFVSMVAHELKAPIGAVEGYLHLFQGGMVDGQPHELRRLSGRCLERTGALLSLVQDLLEITRRDAGHHERRLEYVDIGELARHLVEFHGNEAAARQVRIDVQAESGAAKVLIDPGDLDRVVTNLLSNAIKYNRAGGNVLLRVSQQRGATVLEVTDTGIGMSEEEVGRLGEEFFRAKNPRTRSITGTGLGIALVKKIVDSYSGALQVRSVPEAGSTFTVVLPRVEARDVETGDDT